MSALLPLGSQAPRFSADASTGETLHLENVLERGPVVLIFYPGNNTPG